MPLQPKYDLTAKEWTNYGSKPQEGSAGRSGWYSRWLVGATRSSRLRSLGSRIRMVLCFSREERERGVSWTAKIGPAGWSRTYAGVI